jgi:hypothetical protein
MQSSLRSPAYPAQNLIRSCHIQAGFSSGQQTAMWGSTALHPNNHHSLEQQARQEQNARPLWS